MRTIAMDAVNVMEPDSEFEEALETALLAISNDASDVASRTALQQRVLRRLLEAADAEAVERPRARVLTFGEIGRSQRSGASFWWAMGAHAAAIALIAFVITQKVHTVVRVKTDVARVELSAPPPPPPVLPRADRLRGGGGQHDIAPPAQGHLPKFAETQIVPPKAPPVNEAKLQVEPTVVMQKDLKLADNAMPNLGLPNSTLHGVSLGNGSGTGLGSGNGAGIGPGSGGDMGGGVMHVGGSVRAPIVIHEVDPEYSEEARKAKFSANVEVYLWVDEQGNPSHVRVVRGAGMGLDEKAEKPLRSTSSSPRCRTASRSRWTCTSMSASRSSRCCYVRIDGNALNTTCRFVPYPRV